jgi:hypothetical protein
MLTIELPASRLFESRCMSCSGVIRRVAHEPGATLAAIEIHNVQFRHADEPPWMAQDTAPDEAQYAN